MSSAPPRRDYYEVLGVPRDADLPEVKAAYRALAHRYHPDKNPGDAAAEEVFKEISEAYAVLSDPERRARYDRYGRAAAGEGAFGVQDIFEGIAQAFRGGKRRSRSQGRDVRYTLELGFEEGALGCERAIRYDCEVECPDCRGQTAQCRSCRGRGRVTREREFVVRIPPGAADGNVKTVRGAGEAGRQGGKPGDLQIILRIRPHPLLVREGYDVHCEIPISITQAALGAAIDAPTLDGKVRMKVPPGTQSGKVFRLRGKGVPHGGSRGDQHVHIVVETPARLTPEQRACLERLEASVSGDGTPRQRDFAAAMAELYPG